MEWSALGRVGVRALLVLGLWGCGLSLAAEKKPKPRTTVIWEPISPEVWQMREDPQLAASGAVVLDDYLGLGVEPGVVERRLKLRILSEAGKAGAEITKWGTNLLRIDARVVQEDGSETRIDQETDLLEKKVLIDGDWITSRKALLLPGINSDCVLEIRYAFRPDWRYWRLETWDLFGAFPVRRLVVEVGSGFPIPTFLRLGTFPPPEVETKKGEYTRWTYKDLLPPKNEPFTCAANDPLPKLEFYVFPRQLSAVDANGSQDLWNAVAMKIWKPRFEMEDLDQKIWGWEYGRLVANPASRKGKRVDALVKELALGLPEGPRAKAIELHKRLNARIKRWSHTSQEEAMALEARKISPADQPSRDLELAVEQGGTHSYGWMILYYTLLKAAGVKPFLVLAVSSQIRPLVLKLPSTDQIHWTLIRVDEPGQPSLWIDADRRFGGPGEISPSFQGTGGIGIDTSTWAASVVAVPWREPQATKREYRIELDPSEGGWSFKASASFQGEWDSEARMTFLPYSREGREAQLRNHLEATSMDLAVDTVEVSKPEDTTIPFFWKASGRAKRVAADTRVVVDPFPGLPSMFKIPTNFEVSRRQWIHLGPPGVMKRTALVRLPVGYETHGLGGFVKENKFGKVTWESTTCEEGRAIRVQMEIVVQMGAAPPQDYQDFRQFLAWVDRAQGAKVMLEQRP